MGKKELAERAWAITGLNPSLVNFESPGREWFLGDETVATLWESVALVSASARASFLNEKVGDPPDYLNSGIAALATGERAVDSLIEIDHQRAFDFAMMAIKRSVGAGTTYDQCLENLGLYALRQLSQTNFRDILAEQINSERIIAGQTINKPIALHEWLEEFLTWAPYAALDRETISSSPLYYSSIVILGLCADLEDQPEKTRCADLYSFARSHLNDPESARVARLCIGGTLERFVLPLSRFMSDAVDVHQNSLTVVQRGRLRVISFEDLNEPIPDDTEIRPGSIILAHDNQILKIKLPENLRRDKMDGQEKEAVARYFQQIVHEIILAVKTSEGDLVESFPSTSLELDRVLVDKNVVKASQSGFTAEIIMSREIAKILLTEEHFRVVGQHLRMAMAEIAEIFNEGNGTASRVDRVLAALGEVEIRSERFEQPADQTISSISE